MSKKLSHWRCNWCYKEHDVEEGVLEARQIGDRMALGLYAQCDSIMCKRRNKSRFVPLDCEAKAIHDDRYNEKYIRKPDEKVCLQ